MVGSYKNPMAKYGRGGDTMMAHVSKGDVVLPQPVAAAHPVIAHLIAQAIKGAGGNPDQYFVGSKSNSMNPKTGHPEFGWWSHIWKEAKHYAPAAITFAVTGNPALAAAAQGGTAMVRGEGIGNSVREGLTAYGGATGISAVGNAASAAAAASSLPAGASGPVASGLGAQATVFGNALSSQLSGQLSSAGRVFQAASLGSNLFGGQKSTQSNNGVGGLTATPYKPVQPSAMALPGSLNGLTGFSPEQQRSALATQGVNSGLGKDSMDYYRNLLQRTFIGSNNKVNVSSNSFLSPIESQYFSQRGLNTSDPNQFLSGLNTLQ